MKETELYDMLIDRGAGEDLAHDTTKALAHLLESEDVQSTVADAMEVALNALEQARSDLADVEIIVKSMASDTDKAVKMLTDAIKLIDG